LIIAAPGEIRTIFTDPAHGVQDGIPHRRHEAQRRYNPLPAGKSSTTLFSKRIRDILKGSELLYGSSKIPRSSYCLRHTYATFRLMEGVDVYFLAKQMGTSVRMIEDHYGHITPSKNADLTNPAGHTGLGARQTRFPPPVLRSA
jgi:integrase